jgi:hypothetical protein
VGIPPGIPSQFSGHGTLHLVKPRRGGLTGKEFQPEKQEIGKLRQRKKTLMMMMSACYGKLSLTFLNYLTMKT